MSEACVLVLQPDSSDHSPEMVDWLAEEGLQLDVRDPARDELPRRLVDFAGLVCLSSDVSVHDVEQYPWLLDVQRLLADATGEQLPTLGICLGAQLLAAANGGRVARTERAGVGAGLVSKRDAAWQDPLFADLPLLPDVLWLHRDTVAELPARAVLLAAAADSTNEAFRVGRVSYGLQFHVAATPDRLTEWVHRAPELVTDSSEWMQREVLEELQRDLWEAWRPVATQFAGLVNGTVTPAVTRRLPLR